LTVTKPPAKRGEALWVSPPSGSHYVQATNTLGKSRAMERHLLNEIVNPFTGPIVGELYARARPRLHASVIECVLRMPV